MAESWRRVEGLVAEALEEPRGRREAFLGEIERQDSALASEVRQLLEACEAAAEAPPIALGPPPAESVGSSIANYRLTRELGSGGMATVFLAERTDGEFQHRAAVKVLHRELGDGHFHRRFEAERQILASLRHPRIARLYDGGSTESGQPFFVMDWIDGQPIDEYCERRRLSIPDRLKLVRQVCDAVHFAHRNLVIHRDLKPSNILVSRSGEPILLDFGIAKLLDETTPGGSEPTTTGWRAATPSYSSPEQLRGDPITTASDVYSLGVVLYRLLTGDLPFAPDPAKWLVAKLQDTPVTPPSRALDARPAKEQQAARRQLRGDLDCIVVKALRPEPELRYASAEQLGEDIDRYLEGRPVLARPGTFLYRATRAVRRNKALTAALGGAFVLTLAFSAAMAFQAQTVALARDQAELQRDHAEGVAEFLVDMFLVSHPEEGMGSSISSKELLDLAADRVAVELSDAPDLQARMLETVGRVYRNIGLTEQARSLIEKSYELRLEASGEETSETADTLRYLAQVALDEGRHGEALEQVRRARAAHRRSGATGRKLASDLLLEARVAVHGSDGGTAERLLREALRLLESSPQPRSPETAEVLSTLGQSLILQGRTAEARTALSRSLEISRSLLGHRHPYVASTLNSLISIAHMEQRFEECEELAGEVLAILREFLPEDHHEVGVTLNELGLCLEGKGDLERAEQIWRRLLARKRAKYPEGHRSVGVAMNNLANVLKARGRLAEAEELYREALALSAAVLGPVNPYMVHGYYSLALVLEEAGKTGDALRAYREAVDRLSRLPESAVQPLNGLPKIGLARLLVQNGRTEEAEKQARAGLELISRAFPDDHPYTRQAKQVLSDCLAASAGARAEQTAPPDG